MKRMIILLVVFLMLFCVTVHAESPQEDRNTIKGVLKVVSPSIVKVVAQNHRRTVASGVAIEKDHVISSIELIARPYDEILVLTTEGKEFPAKLVGKDGKSRLILLKINKKSLTPIEVSPDPEVGDWVALVGVFYEKFPTIYQGFVSSTSEEHLLLNAPVAPGYSGGAVVNKEGQLTGVVLGRFGFAFSSDYIYKDHSAEFHIRSPRSNDKQLSIAVPTSMMKRVAADLKKYGKFKRCWVGIDLERHRGANEVRIRRVISDSPAEKGGVRAGDIIVNIDGKRVASRDDVAHVMLDLKPGHKTKFDIEREGKKETLLVVLGDLDEINLTKKRFVSTNQPRRVQGFKESPPEVRDYVFEVGSNRSLGVEAVELTPELAQRLEVKEGRGLMIAKVHEDTAASKAGIREADVIVKAGNIRVRDNADLRMALKRLQHNQKVAITVYRQGKVKVFDLLPDKGGKQVNIFKRFWKGVEKIKYKLEDENDLIAVDEKDADRDRELDKYKSELERMRLQQEKLMKQMEEMRKRIEKEEKDKKDKDKKENKEHKKP